MKKAVQHFYYNNKIEKLSDETNDQYRQVALGEIFANSDWPD